MNYSNINFNPNDGIVTELIVGSPNQKENDAILMFEDNGSPDYCVCYESTGNSVTIKSRWFILESVRVRGGQYRLALKRDVIADHMDFVLRADCFIEKGQILDENSPFLFNRENMTYNQIKKKEIPLYDNTQTSWLVGYIARNYLSGDNDTNVSVTGKINNAVDGTGYDMEDLPWGELTQTQIDNGINFSTVKSIDLLCKLGGTKSIIPNPGGPAEVTYAYMATRSSLYLKNSSVDYIDNNFGLYYEQLVVGGSTGDPTHIAGNTLGDYQQQGFNMDTTSFQPSYWGYQSYPRNSNIVSAQEVAANLMTKSVNGVAIPTALLNGVIGAYNTLDYTGYSQIMALDGYEVKVGPVGSEKYYTIRIQYLGDARDNTPVSLIGSVMTSIGTAFTGVLNEMDKISWNSTNAPVAYITRSSFKVTFIQRPAVLTVDTVIPTAANRWTCNDQLFDMFCIPFGEILVTDLPSGGTVRLVHTRADAALAAARAMAQELGSNLYDLQILPYCPIREIRDAYRVTASNIVSNTSGDWEYVNDYYLRKNPTDSIQLFDIDTTRAGMWFRILDHADNTKVLNYVFWAYESRGTIDVPVLTNQDNYYQYITEVNSKVLRKKISSESEMFRLCSPNYAGLFEYSAAKNNDELLGKWKTVDGVSVFEPRIRYINVDYTYRPGNPYIHLNPLFKGEDQGAVYGKDWNDARGLICSGDFSLGYIVDAYRNYQIQNANFQAIFDRQIQNLDINNAIAKEQTQFASIMSAIGAPVGGAVTGGLAGAKAGGAYGAIAGAAVGATGGAAGGLIGYQLNMDWLERQQQETRDYSIDMYNYHLGNIKALPYSVSKTDCLTENSRLVPFLEVYESTEAEIQNLMNVIKYNGMTVMLVDKPINYLGTENYQDNYEISVNLHEKACYYIKAKLIMNNEQALDDDFHIVDAIYAELDKGIYLQGTEVPESEGE